MYSPTNYLASGLFLKRMKKLEIKLRKGADGSEFSSNWQLRNEKRILAPWPRRIDAFGYQTTQDEIYDGPDNLAAYKDSVTKHRRSYLPNNPLLLKGAVLMAENGDENLASYFKTTYRNKDHHYITAMIVFSSASVNGFEDFMLPDDLRCAFKSEYGVIQAEEVRHYLEAMTLDGPINLFNVQDHRIGRFLRQAAMMGDNHIAMQLDADDLLIDQYSDD